MAVGSKITAVDYNLLRNNVVTILGVGVGPFGYGQSIISSDVAVGQTVTQKQWDDLRFDLVNVRLHQDGVVPLLAAPTIGSVVKFGAGNPNTQYLTQTGVATLNKFKVGVGQFLVQSALTATRTASWKTSLIATVTVSFGTADLARFFFNSGGAIRFSSAITSPSSARQSSTWRDLLSAAGVISFNAESPTANFYSLTDSNQTLYTATVSSPYSANKYNILVKSNISSNITGGATIVIFTIQWIDGYTSQFGDSVTGTLQLSVDQLRASGVMTPSGQFSVGSPSITSSLITGS
jgi:hypothetical protein